jgi:N-acyl-D-aspartate/D-glutamate deacylase
MGDPPDYESGAEMSVAAIARRTGRTPDEVAYDYIIEENQYLYFPVVNYVPGDHEPIREMLSDPACLLGLSDGGAHCTSIVDSGLPSFMLAHWGRDRHRGPRLPVEHLVKRQTSETADFFGLSDRGRLLPGLRAPSLRNASTVLPGKKSREFGALTGRALRARGSGGPSSNVG